jgi:hypothetical protein
MDSPALTARPDVAVATTAPRVTPTPPRTQFKEVLTRSVVSGAEAAMRVLPGSPLMAVAIRGAGAAGTPGAIGVPLPGSGVPMRTMSAEGPGGVGVAATPAQSVGAAALAGAGGAAAPGAAAGTPAEAGGVEQSLQQSQEMNLYYLQIQEEVNAQNRAFSTLSNVLKAEHDTVKTAIGNIR